MIIEELPNGLTIAIRPIKGRECVRISVVSKVGAAHDPSRQRGLAHFCEHALLGGSSEFKPKQVKDTIEKLGGHFNAFTGPHSVSVEGTFAKQDLREGLKLVGDLFFHPDFPESFVNQERQVIMQEIREDDDDRWQVTYDRSLDMFYKKQGPGTDVLGTKTSLKRIKRTDIQKHWRRISRTENCIIYVCGHVTPSNIEYIKEAYAYLPRKKKVEDPCWQQYPGGFKIQREKTERTYCAILYSAPSTGHPNLLHAQVVSSIVADGMNSRLWKKVREQMGASYDISSGIRAYPNNGHMTILAALDPSKWREAVLAIKTEMIEMAEHGPTDKELYPAIHGLKREMIISNDDLEEIASYDIPMLCAGKKPLSLQERIGEYDYISPEGVRQAARAMIANRNPTIHLLGPINPNSSL